MDRAVLSSNLDLSPPEAKYILYDDHPDRFVLHHSLHPLKIWSLKSRTGNVTVYKENKMHLRSPVKSVFCSEWSLSRPQRRRGTGAHRAW